MSIFLNVFPWIIYWLFISFNKIEMAAISGLITTLIVILLDSMKKLHIKILQLGGLIFFLILSSLYFFIDLNKIGKWGGAIGEVAITLIIFISILIKKPFSIQFAKETTPKEVWDTKRFLHINYVISWVWFFALLINSIFSFLFVTIMPVKTWVNWVVALSFVAFAIIFTNIYKKHAK